MRTAQAQADYARDVHAASARDSRDSLLRTWDRLHDAWSQGLPPDQRKPPLPLTVEALAGVGALLKAGRYRSVANYFSRAKDWHVAEGWPWTPALAREQRRATASGTRGIVPRPLPR